MDAMDASNGRVRRIALRRRRSSGDDAMIDAAITAPMSRRSFLAASGAALLLTALPRPASAAAKNAPAIIDAWAKANAFQGVVLLARDGKVAYAQPFGIVDVEAQRPAKIDDLYGIASISKWFTTLAILRLVEQRKLDLDRPITAWLPDYRADTGARINLRRLLSNSSGLTEQYGPAAKADPSLMTLELPAAEAVRRFASADLAFEPGAKFDYIFANWIVVYAIVEAVAGMPFVDAIRTLVLDPLELRHTGTGPAIATAPTTVPSYRTLSPPERRTYDRPGFIAAAVGYFSNAQDLMQAAHRVYDKGFLSPASLHQLNTVEMPEEYALGGRVKTLTLRGQRRTYAWETGNTAGYRSLLAHRLDTHETVVILNNSSMSQRQLDEFAIATQS
ncbi:CubicO group peptidase (beta-lactamase class C family) [Xanthomonas sp. JAI131]|uniref:serine hydrolase domain-containing protein n=1 Tax=unclassified Xanthomonas TaxID=2643310 RepID=UPI00180FC939|nr:serine hydrolase domain-containing protein [Xanthomonas sp. JAI131]NYF20487.1 CubicO group peptidase (beta-lactamase class C family) [Xanthomonas sp. JAI131]